LQKLAPFEKFRYNIKEEARPGGGNMKRSPANHTTWNNLVLNNIMYWVACSHDFAHERYSYTHTRSSDCPRPFKREKYPDEKCPCTLLQKSVARRPKSIKDPIICPSRGVLYSVKREQPLSSWALLQKSFPLLSFAKEFLPLERGPFFEQKEIKGVFSVAKESRAKLSC